VIRYIYEGDIKYIKTEYDLSQLPEVATDIMLNVASPASFSFRTYQIKA
jgi:hypothetical protein